MVRLLSETLSAKLELSALLVIIVLFCLLMVLAGLARATLMSSHDRGLVWCGVVWCGVERDCNTARHSRSTLPHSFPLAPRSFVVGQPTRQHRPRSPTSTIDDTLHDALGMN